MPISEGFKEIVIRRLKEAVREKLTNDIRNKIKNFFELLPKNNFFEENDERKEIEEEFADYEQKNILTVNEKIKELIKAKEDAVGNSIDKFMYISRKIIAMEFDEKFEELLKKTATEYAEVAKGFGVYKDPASNTEATRLSGATRDAGAIGGARPKKPDVILRPPQEITPEREKKVNPARTTENNPAMPSQQREDIRKANIKKLVTAVTDVNVGLRTSHDIWQAPNQMQIFCLVDEKREEIAAKVLERVTQEAADLEQKAKKPSEDRKFLKNRQQRDFGLFASLDEGSKLVTRESEHDRIVNAIVKELYNFFLENKKVVADADAQNFLANKEQYTKDVQPQGLIKDLPSPSLKHPVPAPRRFSSLRPVPAPRSSLINSARQTPHGKYRTQKREGLNLTPSVNISLLKQINCSKALNSIAVKLNTEAVRNGCPKFSLDNSNNKVLGSLKEFMQELNDGIKDLHDKMEELLGATVESREYAQAVCDIVDGKINSPTYETNLESCRAFGVAVLHLCMEAAGDTEKTMEEAGNKAEGLKAQEIKNYIGEHLNKEYQNEMELLTKELEKKALKDAGQPHYR
ncbi:hypothetical protein RLOatenuis_8300 [Rickettsiales bacterium]|nr:hypothetical protein RLOatenuis_8300 [Rickettsiales bacterium]